MLAHAEIMAWMNAFLEATYITVSLELHIQHVSMKRDIVVYMGYYNLEGLNATNGDQSQFT